MADRTPTSPMPKDLMQQSPALKEINRDDLNDAAFVLVTIFVCFLCDTFTFFSFFFENNTTMPHFPPPSLPYNER